MILTDVHTHSAFSEDGKSPLSEMVAEANRKNMTYYGVSEHFDYDYIVFGLGYKGRPVTRTTDAAAYFAEARRLQREYAGKMRLLVGGEYGFADDERCFEIYGKLTDGYQPDFIVNSVHTADGYDCYDPAYFTGKSKEYAYSRYLEQVRKSLEAPYPYDIVGHIGYVSRNAPYGDRKLRYEDFSELCDDVLKTVVLKGKILEANSSARGAGSDFLPDTDLLTRYYELGGRLVSFGSDAHGTARIAEKRELVIAALQKIGFTHLTVPDRGKNIQIRIEKQ